MKRTLKISSNNKIELEFSVDDSNRTWYFVNWDNHLLDENGNFTIYTNKATFGKKIPVFKSKDWTILCNIGNMINGIFHQYFSISNSYPFDPILTIENLIKSEI